MITKRLIRVKVTDLIPYENNPRTHTEESVRAIVASMDQCEPLEPIEVDENMVILAGHGRRLAHIKRGDEYTDAVQYTGLTEEQRQKYRMLHNKVQEFSSWDFEKLEKELEDMDFGEYDFEFEHRMPDEIFDDTFDLKVEYKPPEEPKLRCPCCGAEELKSKFIKV